MDNEIDERVCLKCGSKMREGRIKVPQENSSPTTMPHLGAGFDFRGISSNIQVLDSLPKWEEKTGEKTGILFKRDKFKEMSIKGYRCINCNYIEIYATE